MSDLGVAIQAAFTERRERWHALARQASQWLPALNHILAARQRLRLARMRRAYRGRRRAGAWR